MKERMPSYGGQAVIEGVIMRGQSSIAMANRNPEGEIVVTKEALTGIYTTNIRKIPFLRGLIILWDALGLGMHYLTESANIQTGEDEKLEGPCPLSDPWRLLAAWHRFILPLAGLNIRLAGKSIHSQPLGN